MSSDRDPQAMARLQAVVTAIIRHRVEESLADVETALARWRAEDLSALETHGVILRHAARCERTVERVTAAVADKPAGVARDALDAGLIDEDEFLQVVRDVGLVVEGADPMASDEALSSVDPAGVLRDDDAHERDKRAAVEELLERGPVLVHVDARRDDLSVPSRFKGDPRLILRFGYRLTPAVVDLVVDDAGIAGTLTFGGMPFFCRLPWPAVYAVVVEGEQRGMVWPEDIPAVVADQTDELSPVKELEPEPPVATDPPPKSRGHLKLVD